MTKKRNKQDLDRQYNRATLLISCEDKPGIVLLIANFITKNGGNILHADQHLDSAANIFFQRIEWDTRNFRFNLSETRKELASIAKKIEMQWSLHYGQTSQQVTLFVSKSAHCLLDLLARWTNGEWPKAKITSIVSNHQVLHPIANQFNIPFIHIPIPKRKHTTDLSPADHQEAWKRVNEAITELAPDLIVLARYMQILPKEITRKYRNKIINIHHSFLPAFAGARPYHRAHERGVKLIGATAHYATAELDEGPIIEQDVLRVDHRDDTRDIVRKGRDLERNVLAKAVRLHLNHRVLAINNKTVVF